MLGAVVAANVAAPILYAVFTALLIAFTKPNEWSWEGLLRLIVIFSYAVPFVLLPSLVLALVGLRLGWRSPWIHVVGGGLVGAAAYSVVLIFPGFASLRDFAPIVPAGAICGWIYWVVAVRDWSYHTDAKAMMIHHIGGILTATFAAPYVFFVFLFTFAFLKGGHVELDAFTSIPMAGTDLLLAIGAPMLLVSSLSAVLLGTIKRQSRPYVIASGALVGIVLQAYYSESYSSDNWLGMAITTLPSALSGAISGWIYWRIAIGSKRPLASPQDSPLSP